MLTHSYYEEDPRVRREAESLVAAGREVDVFALRRDGDPATGELAGVGIRRIDVRRHQGASLWVYLSEYLAFFARAGWALARAHRRRGYGLVQVHTLPDFLAFAALPLRLAGVPLLLDLHEAMPEFFRARFPKASNPIFYRLLLLAERLSIGVSSVALTVNPALADRLVRLGVPSAKVRVVPNAPSLDRFDAMAHPRRPFMAGGDLRLVYAGALTPTYEVEVAIDAVAALRRDRPALDVHLDVYGRGDSQPELEAQVGRLGLRDRVRFHGRIPLEDVPAAVADADIGVAPTRRNPFTDVSLSTKIFEYAAMGKPVVATRLPLVETTFPPGTAWTYEAGDARSLAGAVLEIVDDPQAREAAVARTLDIVREGSWEREAERYVALVEDLIGRS
jgi:glycosyltransferase involved in cell wall biosynthesis